MRVGLLSGQVFSPFGEDWLAGSHGGGIASSMNVPMTWYMDICSYVRSIGMTNVRSWKQISKPAATLGG